MEKGSNGSACGGEVTPAGVSLTSFGGSEFMSSRSRRESILDMVERVWSGSSSTSSYQW